MEFHTDQVLYLDNLIWYVGNTDQFVLPHCHMWLNIHVGSHMGALKLSLSGSGQPSDPPPGSPQGLPCTGTSLPPCSDFTASFHITYKKPKSTTPPSNLADISLPLSISYPILSILSLSTNIQPKSTKA